MRKNYYSFFLVAGISNLGQVVGRGNRAALIILLTKSPGNVII